jgi:hypothetical protein
VRPYDSEKLLPYEVVREAIPVTMLDPAEMHPTQDVVRIDRLLAIWAGGPAEGPDDAIHAVDVEGMVYVHNGHHRWLRDLLRGWRSACRVQRADRIVEEG